MLVSPSRIYMLCARAQGETPPSFRKDDGDRPDSAFCCSRPTLVGCRARVLTLPPLTSDAARLSQAGRKK